MAIHSDSEPAWITEDIEQFRQFGFTDVAPAFKSLNSITFGIMLQDMEHCSGESERECREALARKAMEAIAFAAERYEIYSFEFVFSYTNGYPFEARLELTITDKVNR